VRLKTVISYNHGKSKNYVNIISNDNKNKSGK